MLYSSDFVLADDDIIRALEIEYPEIPAADTPGADTDKATTLPEYIKYLFNFGIAIGGILAFLVLVYGGFLWMTSAGDPTAIGKAKIKIFGGIIGLCLLLGAFLIIGMINPELKHLKDVPDMLGKSGVYLCAKDAHCVINDPNKRKRYSGDIPKFPGGLINQDAFLANKACFISKKDELMYLYVHEEKNYKGKIVEEIKNTKDKDEDKCCNECCGDISDGKSLSFLWNKPGIYLYQEPEFVVEGTDKAPEYLRGSAGGLKEWDNITQSIKIVHPDIDTIILGMLFEEPDYSGRCAPMFDGHSDWDTRKAKDPPVLITEIKNLDDATDGKAKIKDDISSIYAFTYNGKSPKGEVNFFDEQNCDGNSFSEEMPEDAIMTPVFFDGKKFSDDSDAEGRVLSFEINGPYVVMIKTRRGYDDDDLECKVFTKRNDSNCYDTVISSNVYSENNDEIRPRMCYIIPSN
jgi:hypothetical protein